MKKRILVIAPHPDDEVLGAGGILAKSKKLGYKTKVLTICTNFTATHSKKKLENANAYASNDFDFKNAIDNLEATSNKVSEILAEAKEKEKVDDFLNLDGATEIIELDDEYSGFGCDLNDSSFKPLEHPHF